MYVVLSACHDVLEHKALCIANWSGLKYDVTLLMIASHSNSQPYPIMTWKIIACDPAEWPCCDWLTCNLLVSRRFASSTLNWI